MKLSIIIEQLKTRRFINKCFRFDKRQFVKFSRALKTLGSEHIEAQMAICTHVIEKGLTMPKMKLGFGRDVVLKLVGLCRTWNNKYDKTNHFYIQATRVLLEYIKVHKDLSYSFEDLFRTELDRFEKDFNFIEPSHQMLFQGEDQFFSLNHSSFPEFSSSRHSVRNFSEHDVPIPLLVDSIKLAQFAPSACNRQTVKVHIVTEKKDIQAILSIQNGNRGFNDLINRLLIITYNIPSYGTVKERNLGFIDSGIFAMNLLYALHYNRIGACTLNWCDSPRDDEKLRTVIHIDEKETISLLIACGFVPDHEFKVAKSERIDVQSIIVVH